MRQFYLLALLISFVIIALHIVSAFSKDKIAKILNFVNIGLHIVVFLFLLLADAVLELLALFMMCSILVYLLSAMLSLYVLRNRRADDDL